MKDFSLTSAYNQGNQGLLDLLQRQLKFDFNRFDLELLNQRQMREEQAHKRQVWEKERAEKKQEISEAQEAEAEALRIEANRVASLQQQKMEAACTWLSKGKSATEIEILTWSIFG